MKTMFRSWSRLALCLFAIPVLLFSCKKDDAPATQNGKYQDGFFIINEGWYGHETGTVYFYDRQGDSLRANIYQAENPDKVLGTITSTLQYATIFNNKMYMVVKVGGPLVTVDPATMKEIDRIEPLPGNNGVSFLGLNEGQGLLGTTNGLYLLGLSPLSLGAKVTEITGAIGDMAKTGAYLFIGSQKSGLVVLNNNTFSTAKSFANVQMGPVVSGDGANVWAIAGNNLLKINAQTLAADTVKLAFTAVSPYGAWRSTAITSSTKENAVFYAENKSFTGATKIYKYVVGNTTSATTPFITLPEGQYCYGKAVSYNKVADELIVTTLNGAYTGNINRVLFYNATTGELKKTLTYNGWHFPAMPVFY